MPADPPRLSIVTPTLNRRAMLTEAVESVRRQELPAHEHLIVDGGSSDGTRDWVLAQPDLTYIPPPDRGVYDAMNKGIDAARGEIIGLLNSDDLYEPGSFDAVVAAFAANPQAGVVAGWSRLMEGDRTLACYDQPLDLVPTVRAVLIGRCLPNPRFFRREALAAIGPIETRFGLVADRDLLARIVEAGIATVPLARPVYVYRRHAGSLTFDAGLRLSQRLRAEMVALGRHWGGKHGASAEARRAGRELEGRQRLMLALVGLRAGAVRAALGHLLLDEGRASLRAPGTVLAALGRAGRGG